MQNNEQARLGAYVTVELIDERGHGERMSVDIVREEHADLDQDRLGVQTPLAKAIIGKKVGALVNYRMGDIRQVRIVSVRPSQLAALENTEEQRQAQLQKALPPSNAPMLKSSPLPTPGSGAIMNYATMKHEQKRGQNDFRGKFDLEF